MIVVDTNVVSEAMKPEPDARVVRWLNEQRPQSLFATTINVAELRYGVERLPDGKRKSSLWDVLNFTMERLFEKRILSFDLSAAAEAARIAATTEAEGQRVAVPDGQIAAIARAQGFVVATRDVQPFEASGVEVINPGR